MFRDVCILFLFWIPSYGVSNIVRRSPYCKENICEFRWVVDYKFTMMWYNRTSPELEYQPIIQDSEGYIRRRSTTPNCTETHTTVTLTEFEEVVSTGDGDYRMVYAINGQIPGPEIIVTEGDMVSIRIFNRLKMEGLTIHWHGLLHRGTPWMDGASMISQCPILPGQWFEYRFLAEPVGTHWYHAHTNTMRNDGLSGAFIVLPKQPPHPPYHGEFFAVVQDWTKRSAAETAETYRSRLFGLGDYDETCTPADLLPDGTASIFSLNVGLVNGRGRKYISGDFVNGEKPFIPMEIFTVDPMKWYRFRIINAGFAQPFQISFEGHTVYVVALDGNDVYRQKCDTVVISPGESVDIQIKTKRSPNNYYINFQTLPTQTQSGPIQRPRMTRAILNYKGVSRYQQALSVPRLCTQRNPCYVVNQLYGRSPATSNVVNIPLMKIRSTPQSISRNPVPTTDYVSSLQEFFLNFHFFQGQPAINGRRFMYPTSALQTHRSKRGTTPCTPPYCSQDRCRCTHTLKLEIDNVIQFVFFTQGLKAAHPIHFHGHQFHVVKIGYPNYDYLTGNATAANADIKCLNDDCTEATWADPSWHYVVPGLNLKDPPIKDTVNIPWGGYVVVRIKADNPGYWLLHCHLGHHQSQGMSLVLQEGDPEDMVKVPKHFPTCQSFVTSQQQVKDAINNQKMILQRKRSSIDDRSHSKKTKLNVYFKSGEQHKKGVQSGTGKTNVRDFFKGGEQTKKDITSSSGRKSATTNSTTIYADSVPQSFLIPPVTYNSEKQSPLYPNIHNTGSQINSVSNTIYPGSSGNMFSGGFDETSRIFPSSTQFRDPPAVDLQQVPGSSVYPNDFSSTNGAQNPFNIPTATILGDLPYPGALPSFGDLPSPGAEPSFGDLPYPGALPSFGDTLSFGSNTLPSGGSTDLLELPATPFVDTSSAATVPTFGDSSILRSNSISIPSFEPADVLKLPENPLSPAAVPSFGDLPSPVALPGFDDTINVGSNNLPTIGSTDGSQNPFSSAQLGSVDNSGVLSSGFQSSSSAASPGVSGTMTDYFAGPSNLNTLDILPQESPLPLTDSSTSFGGTGTTSADPFQSFNSFFTNNLPS